MWDFLQDDNNVQHMEFKSKSPGFLLVRRDIYACRNSSRFTSLKCALQIKNLGHQRAGNVFKWNELCNSLYPRWPGIKSHHHLVSAQLAPQLCRPSHLSQQLCVHVQSKPAIGHTAVKVLFLLSCLHMPLIPCDWVSLLPWIIQLTEYSSLPVVSHPQIKQSTRKKHLSEQ